MPKPWEETWTADGPDIYVDAKGANPGFFGELDVSSGYEGSSPCVARDFGKDDEARARLAAAAPELYRALEAILRWLPSEGQAGAYAATVRLAGERALCKARGEEHPLSVELRERG